MKDAKAKAKRRFRDKMSLLIPTLPPPRAMELPAKRCLPVVASPRARKLPKSKLKAIEAGLTDSESSESEAGELPLSEVNSPLRRGSGKSSAR